MIIYFHIQVYNWGHKFSQLLRWHVVIGINKNQ